MTKKFDPQKAAEKVAKKPEVAKRLLECFKKMKGQKSWTVGQLTAAIVQDGFNDLLDLRPPYGTPAEDLQAFRDELVRELEQSEPLAQSTLTPKSLPALTVLATEPKTSPAASQPTAAADADIPAWLRTLKAAESATPPVAPLQAEKAEPEPPPISREPNFASPAHYSGNAVLRKTRPASSRFPVAFTRTAIIVAGAIFVVILALAFVFFVNSRQTGTQAPLDNRSNIGPQSTTPVAQWTVTPVSAPTQVSPANTTSSGNYVPPIFVTPPADKSQCRYPDWHCLWGAMKSVDGPVIQQKLQRCGRPSSDQNVWDRILAAGSVDKARNECPP